jgi:hypothetical protein
LQSALESGAWIAMSGQVFEPNRVRKNRDRGVFERIDSL